MSTSVERVFVVGATGDIGSGVVRGLVKKGINTTAYVRDEKKAKDLFQDEMNSGHLVIVVGSYTSIDVYTKAIEGHTRLFLLAAAADSRRPTAMSEIKGTFGRIAYEKDVRQIVDLSSFSVRSVGRQGIIGYMHTTAEDKLWAFAEEKPNERSLVILRPASFMTNHFMGDVKHVKHSNKLVSAGSSSSRTTWIDTKDISDCAVVILTESIEKHDRCVYEMGSQTLTNEERANIFSQVLGKSIIYEQQSLETIYKTFTGFGMAHSIAYDILSFALDQTCGHVTPQLSILLNRPLRTLEDWLKDNVNAFQ